MKTDSTARALKSSSLSVSHKAASEISDLLHHLPDAVIITDLSFRISGWNDAAEKLHGMPGAMGKNLFNLIRLDFINTSFKKVQEELLQYKNWQGEVIYYRHDGEKFVFSTIANPIFNENNQPTAFIFVNHNITHSKNTERKLEEAEATYEKLVNTLLDGVLMMDKEGRIKTCNKRAAQILGFEQDELPGKEITNFSWNAIKPDGSAFPKNEFPPIVSLQTGFPQRNVKMGLDQPGGSRIWLSVNSEALIRANEFEPYAVVVSFSDITDMILRDEELRKSNERFYYVSKITTDAIWDLDLQSNEIYRSEAFCELSGYNQHEIKPDLNWWFDKVHPDDRQRVKNKVADHLKNGEDKWEDEYLFLCADGNYRYLVDSGIILYRYGKPVRILGAIQDITEKKKLEKDLLVAQEQKHKAINQAVIAAQETERSNISRELHDNVNQLLMSAKLFMNSASSDPENSTAHIEKAMTYQMMAVEEIRRLSKSLNTSLVKMIGLGRSIDDLVINMKAFQQIETNFQYDQRLDRILSDDQKLMLFRILQEQTNNIVKYSGARNVVISIKEENNKVALFISDDGKGFDTSVPAKGIGLVNIYNRIEAFGGTCSLISSPGNGCTLEIFFPLELN